MGAAAAPMIIGSAIGGLVNKRNPLQGALLGGALGGIGGSVFSGAQGLASAAAAPAQTAAISAQPALSYGAAQTAAGQTMAAPGLLETIKQVPQAMSAFSGENPVLTQMTLMGAQNALQTPPRPQLNPNLMRGSPMPQQAQAQRFQTNVPQVSLI